MIQTYRFVFLKVGNPNRGTAYDTRHRNIPYFHEYYSLYTLWSCTAVGTALAVKGCSQTEVTLTPTLAVHILYGKVLVEVLDSRLQGVVKTLYASAVCGVCGATAEGRGAEGACGTPAEPLLLMSLCETFPTPVG